MKACLDSDFLIEVLAGDAAALSLLEDLQRASTPSISAVSAYEVTNIDVPRKRALAIEALATVDIVPVDGSVALAASHLSIELKRAGRQLPPADLLIAATCVLRGLTLVTRNAKHFGRIHGLKTRAW